MSIHENTVRSLTLYLDFDGVLHPSSGSYEGDDRKLPVTIPANAFCNLEHLHTAIDGLPVRIVITSNWRRMNNGTFLHDYVLAGNMPSWFVDSLHPQPVTPYTEDDDRRREIDMHAAFDGATDFLVLDDWRGYFGRAQCVELQNASADTKAEVLICKDTGLDEAQAKMLRRIIQTRLMAVSYQAVPVLIPQPVVPGTEVGTIRIDPGQLALEKLVREVQQGHMPENTCAS